MCLLGTGCRDAFPTLSLESQTSDIIHVDATFIFGDADELVISVLYQVGQLWTPSRRTRSCRS